VKVIIFIERIGRSYSPQACTKKQMMALLLDAHLSTRKRGAGAVEEQDIQERRRR